MTITRRWQAGAEPQDFSEFSGTIGNGNTTIFTSSPKTGGASFRFYGPASDTCYGYVAIPATRQIRGGLFFRIDSVSATFWRFFTLNTPAGGLVDLRYTRSNGGVSLWVNNSQIDEITSCSPGTWYHIGFDIKIHPTDGWAKFYLDGILILSFEGNTGDVDITTLYTGKVSGSYSGGSGLGTSFTLIVDDLYIDDTTGESTPQTVPIKRFFPAIADGNGYYSQWTGSDGNQVDNYALVDETPPNADTDYVQALSADLLDSYAMSTYTLQANESCVAIIPYAVVKRTGTTEQLALGTRLSSTDLVGSDQNPPTAYGVLWERQETKPGGGAWTQSDIDGFEAVIKSRGTY
jgi:hypothetical protein